MSERDQVDVMALGGANGDGDNARIQWINLNPIFETCRGRERVLGFFFCFP